MFLEDIVVVFSCARVNIFFCVKLSENIIWED